MNSSLEEHKELRELREALLTAEAKLVDSERESRARVEELITKVCIMNTVISVSSIDFMIA